MESNSTAKISGSTVDQLERSSASHPCTTPQSNGAVERANGQIFSAIKKCLFEQKKGKWADELSRVIWSHNTTELRTTKFTPFRLLYGTEAMCPEELNNESARVLAGSSRESEEADKDLLEIDRLDAVQNLLKYQEETRRWRNKKVSLKDIKVGDFVLKRKKNANTVGKFQFAWEGPYMVSNSVRDGAFGLKDEAGVELPQSWNVDNLCKFFP
jgi:hypothetical protein